MRGLGCVYPQLRCLAWVVSPVLAIPLATLRHRPLRPYPLHPPFPPTRVCVLRSQVVLSTVATLVPNAYGLLKGLQQRGRATRSVHVCRLWLNLLLRRRRPWLLSLR